MALPPDEHTQRAPRRLGHGGTSELGSGACDPDGQTDVPTRWSLGVNAGQEPRLFAGEVSDLALG